MKKTFILLSLLTLLGACTKKSKYTLDWDLSMIEMQGAQVDSVQIVINDEVAQTITSLKDGHLAAEGEIDEPTIATLKLYISSNGESDCATTEIILEEGNIVYDASLGCASGTKLNDGLLNTYKNIIDESNKEGFSLENATDIIEKFITNHKSDISSVFMLACSDFVSALSPEDSKTFYDLLSPEMKKQPKAKEVKARLDLMSKSAEGQPFIDFEAEYEGKIQRLSDYVGKGKYCLVDFWASWCGPCRQEIPNIIEVFEKYGDKINVLGVASWDEPENTLKAIEELGIRYPQIMNAQAAGTDAYSISGIPEIILFSPEGKILKRGLREGEIMKAVEEVVK